MPLAEAQAAFAEEGQMLALDPPLGDDAATIGGVVATGDSGPLRHRYGGVRDLVVGITVALSDGTVAKAGGKVIKNVAGYDLAKLFTGSFGTLGLIVEVSAAAAPAPAGHRHRGGARRRPRARWREAAAALARLPLEADSLDVGWRDGAGRVLARFGGAAAAARPPPTAARGRARRRRGVEDDEELWSAQRAGQRPDGAVLKVSGRPGTSAPASARRRPPAGRSSRAPRTGLSWITLEARRPRRGASGTGARALWRRALRRAARRPGRLRAALDPWGPVDAGALVVMRRVKERFDPTRIFRPGAFVGGI